MARILLEFVALLLVAWPCCLAVDKTQEEKAYGTEVVEATVDLIHESCIFDDDKMMLRRIAWVETADGEDPHTFERRGKDYYGGIWQIDELTFEFTKEHEFTLDKYQAILDEFGIDWFQVDYKDLLKPLHCGLAARLWIDMQTSSGNRSTVHPGGDIPRSVDEQADFWADYYRTPEDAGSSPRQQYIDKVDNLDYGCDVPKADIIFVLDGSGSIELDNFLLMKDFVKDIVSDYDIGADGVRVGLIRYSSTSDVQFGLGTHNDLNSLLVAIEQVSYEKGGTNSHLALQDVVTEFSTGARTEAGIPQICIFMTDGQSNDVQATQLAANAIHNHPTLKITMFAVGVGNGAVRSELETIASEPSCIHVFMLETFADMNHFQAQLEKTTCGTPAEMDPGEDAEGTIPSGTYIYFKLKVKRTHQGITIKIKMKKGSSRAYVSYKVRNPSRVIHDFSQKVDSSQLDGKYLGIPFPEDDVTSLNETEVFMSLLGDGMGEENQYQVGYEDGYSGVPGLKPTLMSLLAAALLAVLLKQ